MPAIYIPINGDVLTWAMEQAGVDDVELAERCDTSPDVVEEWREGELRPTKTQFRKLVARLRRPAAIYFLVSPPADDTIIRAFRNPPGVSGERVLTDAELRAIQMAERLQRIGRWIREQRGDDAIAVPRYTGGELNTGLKAARRFLDWSVDEQVDAPSATQVAKLLRERLERVGILVLQFPMKPAGCRGFSLDDDLAPVIAINSAYTTEARIFSYMHEYAHLARGSGSICSRVPDSALERRCEQFAAAFLMPRAAFERYLKQTFGDRPIASVAQVSRVAKHFNVSLRATALRIERLGRAVEGLYDNVDAEADFKGPGGFSRDNSAPAVRLREWGAAYAELLLDAERRHVLGRTDVLEYLNLSNQQLTELRARVETGSGAEG